MKRWAIAPAIVAVGAFAWYAGHRDPPKTPEAPPEVAEKTPPKKKRVSALAAALSGGVCRVRVLLSKGTGRTVRVYSELARADVDAVLDPEQAAFEAEMPTLGPMSISAVATDGRAAQADVVCSELGVLQVELAFPPVRKGSAAIEGRCLYLETGAPVAGARVYSRAWSTISDELGRFVMRTHGGAYAIRCAKDGDESEPTRMEIAAGETRKLELHLAASTSIVGRVIDESGAAVEGAQVSMRPPRGPQRDTESDASGTFELRGVPPGPVIISAQLDGAFAEKSLVARLGLPYADVELLLSADTGMIRGVVFDDHDEPVEGAEVTAYGPIDRTVKTGADGRFAIAGLPDSAVTLEVNAPGFAEWRKKVAPPRFHSETTVHLERACTAQIMVVPADPKLAIEVQIEDQHASGETGEVISVRGVRGEQTIKVSTIGNIARSATLTATVCPTDRPIEVSLESEEKHGTVVVEVVRENGSPVQDASVGIAPLGLSAHTDRAGVARFLEVPPGWHDVVVGSERESVEVKENETARVKISIHDEEGEVSGFVTAHDRPVEGAAIRAACGTSGYPRNLDGAELVARTNGAGAFAFDPQEGSVCTVRAEHGDEGTSDAVVLRVGGLPAELEIRGARSIDGVVLERESSAPVPSYELSVTPLGRTSDVDGRSMMISDPSGRFHLDGLAPSLISIAVRSDRGRGHVEVDLSRADAPQEIEIRVLEEGVVTGRVVANTQPVPNARVQLRRVHSSGWSEPLVDASSDQDGRFVLRGRGGDALRVVVNREGYYPYGTMPFDFDGLSAMKDLGDLSLSPRSGRDEKEGGIGIQFAPDRDRGVRVVDFISDSPARQAGLEIGDVITAIDGTAAGRLPLVSWLVLLRGPVGTPVALEIERGTLPHFTVTVIRRSIGLPDLPEEAP